MLEISNPTRDSVQQYGAAQGMAATRSAIDLSSIVGFFRRQWPVILAGFVVTLALAITYVFVAPARYTAKTLLMLDTRRAQVFQQQSVVGELSFDESAVGSQIEILRSVNVARAVVKDQKLLQDPEFTGQTTSFFGSMASALSRVVSRADAPNSLTSEDDLMQVAVAQVQRSLTVQRVGRTYVLEIGFKSLDRSKAARIANGVGDAYILDQLEAKFTATKRASTWLRERISELREEATNSDRAVQDFKVQNDIMDSGRGAGTIGDQQLSEINTQLVTARLATAEARARLDRIREVNDGGAVSATVADALHNDVINRLRQQWVEASKREAEFSARYGKDHQAVINLHKEMEQIQRLTADELKRIAETYASDYEIARNREQTLQTGLADTMKRVAASNQAQVALRVLESSAKSYRTLYDSFLSRFVEATQQQSFPNTEARVITPATSADKTEPRSTLTLLGAAFAGLALGTAAALAREQLDRVFRLPSQVERTLGVECLGVLPEVDSVTVTRKIAGLLEHAPPPTVQRPILRNLGIGRYVVAEPFSRFAETLRGVKVSADTSAPGGHVKVVGMVSAVPSEGKSTVSLNMAELLAQTGSRSLLIDGDLRNPSLTRLIAPEAKKGLLEVLNGQATIDDVVWTDPLTGMLFVPAVLSEAIAHTSGIMASQGMERFLTVARERYDYVIVDLPPMAPVVDARAAAHLLDGFVMVIEWGKTSPEIVLEALEGAEVVRERMIGAILNKANTTVLKRLEAYKGANYHRYYTNYQSG